MVQEQTVIYISHRLALAKTCDEIIVIEDGKAAEVGAHDELMQQNGIYAEMYRLQADQYGKTNI
ncbi:MAG: ABC transporter ATP-binding protein [Lachnospiraceae bacterium]|nr:ABC transporter ATP-binding protein [Lachnospiraceae bacterium]MBO5146071.1 ABC transporter ATP-binding protein [Lachnospiraceae bacterium]